MTDTTIDMYPVSENGHLVYAAPAPLSTEAGGTRIGVLVLAALAVLAMVVLALLLIDGAMVMACTPRRQDPRQAGPKRHRFRAQAALAASPGPS